MEEFITLTLKERHYNTICEIECSELYNQMIENGDTEYLLDMFNQAISVLSERIRKERCEEEFTEKETDLLSLVLGLVEEEYFLY